MDGKKKDVLLDVRDLDEWHAEAASPYGPSFKLPRKGRIPGATHLYWKNLLYTDSEGINRFKSKEEIRDLLKEVGITPE